jgi:Ca2+-binding RTX toxin-like protein
MASASYGFGGGGNDTMTLGSSGGFLFGQDGDDRLVGGSGINQFIGGAGADQIVIGVGSTANYVYDFSHDDGDHIEFHGMGATTVMIDESPGGGWSIVTAGSVVAWVNTGTGGALVAGDFLFS